MARVCVLLAGALAVAAALPDSELLFAVTGAVGVCGVCYALPVALHLRLPGALRSGGGVVGGATMPSMMRFAAVPMAALAGGACLSALGLYSTLRDA